MDLTQYISLDHINLALPGNNKNQILANLIQILADSVNVNNQEHLLDLLKEREGLGTTGIGYQVAIPHCKSAEFKKLHIVCARSQCEIDYNALDHLPVKLFFLLVAPLPFHHDYLKALAQIGRLIKVDPIRNLLMTTSEKEVFYENLKLS